MYHKNLSRQTLIVRVPLVCDRQSGSAKRIVHDCKRVSNRPAYTPGHKSAWNYNYTNTLTPTLTLPAACTELQTTFSIGLEPQKRWFQIGPTSAATRGRGLDKSRVRFACNPPLPKRGEPLSPSSAPKLAAEGGPQRTAAAHDSQREPSSLGAASPVPSLSSSGLPDARSGSTWGPGWRG